jgi:parvulin-like peptidyl-prolyl isomerase
MSGLLFILLLTTVLSGCASMQRQSDLIATVDGEPIVRADLEYALQIAHRREKLTSTEPVNIRRFINRLIDEKLIVQEARRSGLDKNPEIESKVKAFILRESVTRLYREEVLDKASGKEERERLAAEYLESLRRKYSPKTEMEVISSIPDKMTPSDRKDLSMDSRIVARAGAYELTMAELVKMMPERMMNKTPVDIVKGWIDRKVVDIEALGRQYYLRPDLAAAVNRYRDKLVLREFVRAYIRPEIRISKEDLKEYYAAHKQDFPAPARYKIQQITVYSAETARDVRASLVEGADFGWMAKQFSKDVYAAHGGVAGWFVKEQLDSELRKIIDTMKPGDLSPVFGSDRRYIIVRIMERRESEPQSFSRVRERIMKRLYRQKYNEIFRSYADKLKEDAVIVMYEENIRPFEEAFGTSKKPGGRTAGE